MSKDPDKLAETKRLMGALVRMKPKPHEELKRAAPKKNKPRKTSAKERGAK